MRTQTIELAKIVLAVLLILTAGTFGYVLIEEGWSVLDGLYMTVITVTTIGFGEIHELSPAGRVFTILLIFSGLGLAGVFATHVAKMIVESGIRNLYGKRKMKDKVARLKDHHIVCGYGGIGAPICLNLDRMGLKFVVVDSDQARLEQASARGTGTFVEIGGGHFGSG